MRYLAKYYWETWVNTCHWVQVAAGTCFRLEDWPEADHSSDLGSMVDFGPFLPSSFEELSVSTSLNLGFNQMDRTVSSLYSETGWKTGDHYWYLAAIYSRDRHCSSEVR